MSETGGKSNKRRKHNAPNDDQITANRSLISGNWQKLLSSHIMENKPEKTIPNNHYSGTFRRSRRKNEHNLKTDKEPQTIEKPTEKRNKLTKFVAMDCEMVGIGTNGADHMLARVSIVNKFGDCIYDRFVKAREEVVDYRTKISGIRREDMLNGEEFSTVQKEVAEMLRGRILVGHSLKHDLGVLFLSHPKKNIRDTSKYKPFKKITLGSTPSLKRLAKEVLAVDIQDGEHSSVEDARAAMQLYCTVASAWEGSLHGRRGRAKI